MDALSQRGGLEEYTSLLRRNFGCKYGNRLAKGFLVENTAFESEAATLRKDKLLGDASRHDIVYSGCDESLTDHSGRVGRQRSRRDTGVRGYVHC